MNTKRNYGAALRACIVAGSLVFAGTTVAQAQDDMEQAVEVRRSLLQLVRWNLGPLGNMARGRIPLDIEQVGTNAARIEGLFGMMGDAFATDTRGADVETEHAIRPSGLGRFADGQQSMGHRQAKEAHGDHAGRRLIDLRPKVELARDTFDTLCGHRP